MCRQIKTMRPFYFFIVLISLALNFSRACAQDSSANVKHTDTLRPAAGNKVVLLDTLKPQKDSASVALAKKDSVSKVQHDPRKATRRSAIIPGWGQAYNHQIWKIPIVYGALAVPASLFVYNNTWYQRTKDAYNILVNGGDTSQIHDQLQGLSAESMQYYRNVFRKNRDYSALFFLLVWGLNVADATVSAHLKDFDIGNDLSMHVEPDFNGKNSSLSVLLNFKTPRKE